jgi:hypothetical protein
VTSNETEDTTNIMSRTSDANKYCHTCYGCLTSSYHFSSMSSFDRNSALPGKSSSHHYCVVTGLIVASVVVDVNSRLTMMMIKCLARSDVRYCNAIPGNCSGDAVLPQRGKIANL